MTVYLGYLHGKLDKQYGWILAQTPIRFGTAMYRRALELLEAADRLGADTPEFRAFCQQTRDPDAKFKDSRVIRVLSEVPDGTP